METKCCGTCKWHECEMDDSWIASTATANMWLIGQPTITIARNGRNADELLQRKQMPRHPS